MRTAIPLALIALVAFAPACNCGGKTNTDGGNNGDGGATDGGSVDLTGLQSISISPANQTLTVNGSTPATSAYSATGTWSDGHTADITSATTFSLVDPSLGTFAGRNFTSVTSHGGTTVVIAQAGASTATTGLTVQVTEAVNDPNSTGLPPNPGNLFNGPATGAAPSLVYPNDGVLVPPNLGKLEFHFLPGSGNTVFELSFENALTDVKVYLQCGTPVNGGCVYLPDPTVWNWIALTNRGGAGITVKVRGTDSAGTAVGSSATIQVLVSNDAINGGLYYWTTSSGTGIMRYDFAGNANAATRFAGVATVDAGVSCVGCHALSRDGKWMVAEVNGQNDGRLFLMDVANNKLAVPFPTPAKSIFESWNPDGGQFVGVYGDTGATDWNLLLMNGATGGAFSQVDIAGTGSQTNPADHPDWSSDGNKIAYVKVGQAGTMQRMWFGAIEMITTSNGGQSWSSPQEIVPRATGKNRYYPAFSPDNSFLVFDESTCANGTADSTCNADTDMTATLFAAPAQPGATPIPLTRANAPGVMDNGATALTNTFPKWSPFVFQRSTEVGSRLMWITFSSARRYGLRKPPAGGTENPSGTFIWMAAIDPDKVAQGVDPSYPAFCLPFQDITTSNHIAQWTTQVLGQIQ